jgi:hypothetical protein
MAIQIATTRQTLADAYKGTGTWFGLATGNPGTSATPANEATGGGYARVQLTWVSGSGGSLTTSASATISAAAGTYTYAILASAATTGAANMVDNCSITSTTLSAAGQIVLTPTFTLT